MGYKPCRKRLFRYRISLLSFYQSYLRWFRHLRERLGAPNTLSIWHNTFSGYDDTLLMQTLSSGWETADNHGINLEARINELLSDSFPGTHLELSMAEVRDIIENTPPIVQIKQLFLLNDVEKEITAYEALHIRFDGLACLAEAIIEKYGKQGELIVYDLVVQERLLSSHGNSGSVEDFIESFGARPDERSLFTAGLETELIHKTKREVVLDVHECEWARYYQERHPQIGYLMACSTDEVAYKAFNKNLRMRRTQTIMEGSEKCDFWIYAVSDRDDLGNPTPNNSRTHPR